MIKKTVLLLLCLLPCARAELWLPTLFSDNMVLQRDMPVRVLGRGEAGSTVTVSFAGQERSAAVDGHGNWHVALEPLKPSAVPGVMTVAASTGDEKREFRNILVGDVWVCSGQSNMEIPVSQALNPEKEIAAANHPEIRLFKVQRDVALSGQEDVRVDLAWISCAPDTVGNFSAVAYYFGREIHREAGVPIGLIQSTWGGTPITAWTPVSATNSDPECAAVMKPWDELRAKVPDYETRFRSYVEERKNKLDEFNRILWQWVLREKEAKKSGTPFAEPAPKFDEPTVAPGHWTTPGGLFNAMISPLTPFAIRGVIWYQGESNAGSLEGAKLYGKQLPLLIESWREGWSRPDLPFYFVQIANYMAAQKEPHESNGWPLLRDMQLQTWKNIPHTGMAAAIDLGEADNIHPLNKQEVGRRLALHALKNEYGKNVTVSGPVFRSCRRDGDKAILKFDFAEGGLESSENMPGGFALCDSGGKWFWAQAEIVGEEIRLQCDQVPHPSAVAYNWANNPIGNVRSKSSGLPLVPFCATPGLDNLGVRVDFKGGAVEVHRLEAFELQPIWQKSCLSGGTLED